MLTFTGSFLYKMKSGDEIEFEYTGIIYPISDHRADEVRDVTPAYGENVPLDDLEAEQDEIEKAALNAAASETSIVLKKEYGGN